MSNESRIEVPADTAHHKDEVGYEPGHEEGRPEVPPRTVSGWRWAAAMTAVLGSMFLYSLDITVVASVQPLIVTQFDAVDKLPWLSVAVLLGATATNMVWGRMYTQFNAKWLYIFNVFLFEVGSAICGAAPNMDVFIVGRAICGISCAGLYVGVMTLIAVTTTMAERPLYNSATGLLWGLGIVLGPLVGGGFGKSAVGWRWAFYINLCIGAICAPAWLFLLPSVDPRLGVSYRQRAAELDYLGTVAWNSGHIIGLFVTSGVLFAMLGIQQVWTIFTTQARRLIPIQFFRSKMALILFSCTAASGSAVFIPVYFVPLFFQFTRSDDALQAGVRLLPLMVILVVTIIANGVLMAKFGYYMPWYLVGGLLTVTGGALMSRVNQNTADSTIYGFTVFIGVGVGMFIQASFSIAQAVVKSEDIPAALGFITQAQFLGNTITLAIGNTTFLNLSAAGIARVLPGRSTEEIQSAIEGAAGEFLKRLSPQERSDVMGVITDAIGRTYALVITAGGLVVLLSLFMKKEKLFMTGGVSAA